MRTRKKGPSWDHTATGLLVFFATTLLLINNPTQSQQTSANNQTSTQQSLCRVEKGLSSIIVDIAESIDDQLDQVTTPTELPIIGDPRSDIELTLVYPAGTQRYFALKGKQLILSQPLDRDENDISSIVFQAVCAVKASTARRTIPIIVRVSDLNDNSPVFEKSAYEISIPESTPVGTTVFRGIRAHDTDAGVNGLVEYSIVDSDEEKAEENGFGLFVINSPHHGVVTLNRTLDFEKSERYFVTILASDRAFDPKLRKTSTTTLTVNVIDSDDQGPTFVHHDCISHEEYCLNAEYNATVTRGVLSGILDIRPERILAIDRDSIKSPIQYSFVTGSPASFLDYFHIDPATGTVRQIRPVVSDEETKFNTIVKATEISDSKKFATAKLSIIVLAEDRHPPILQTTSLIGFVAENSPVGTTVLSLQHQQPIRFTVMDPDLAPNDPKPNYQFELTTTAFRVNEERVLVVAEEHLDRDPPHPSNLQFQMIVREIGYGYSASSSPLILSVKITDENDSPPFIHKINPVTIPGGDGKRSIVKIIASDNDEGINAQIRFSLHHVSNNGKDKFTIDPSTGLLEAVGKVTSGEIYSITVQAMDGGGRSSQSIVDVKVVDGENLKPPIYPQFAYDVSVSEGATIGTEVIKLEAKDPEGKPVTYEIIGGNDLHHFTIGRNTGVVTVNSQLDREDLSRYSLMVKAEDEGGLFSVTHVNIKLDDLNDNNGVFLNTPYQFHVKEGLKGKVIGRVLAKDLDEGENGMIRYEVPVDSPIDVDEVTGEIRTRVGLDYEREKTHHVVITARDMGKESRISTATVTIAVEDDSDEMPVFKQFTYEVTIPENSPDLKIVRVEAFDPDTTATKITYYIKQGPYDKFSIDPVTGEIYATQRLDYEEASKHILIVGTEENDSGNVGSTTTVVINVQDENDIPPMFSIIPRPIRLEDTAHVGFVLTQLQALDSDGTSPGNKVKYEVIGRGKAGRYFEVHPDTGIVSVKDDLRKEMDTEYQLDVRAYDLGEPSLEQVATVRIYVDHVATVPPDVGVGFADIEYTVEVVENAAAGKAIKLLTIVNKPNEIIPISCEIRNGNEENLFEVTTTKDRNCLLSLTRPNLDYERAKSYEIQVQLVTLPGVISKKRSLSTINVKILDENDNSPVFNFDEHQKVARGRKFFGAISEDGQISTAIMQIQAQDSDSNQNGEIRYELESDNPLALSYFTIDPKSGMLTSRRTTESVSPTLLPFRLTVVARDNPNGVSHVTKIPLVVNIISSEHRMVIVIEGTTPDRVKIKERDVIEIIQEISNLIIGIEKITPHRFMHGNGTLDTDYAATDIWFYAVDPVTDHILERESPKVSETILSHEGSKSIAYFVSSKLSVRAREVRKPLTRAPLPPSPVGPLQSEQQWAAFPAALVALAGLIFIVSVMGISFMCYKWSRYTAFKNQGQRVSVLSPRYEPVYMEHSRSPSLKQYETQVLQMRVNADEGDSGSDLHVDMNLNRNHVYSGESLHGRGTPTPSNRTEATTVRPMSDLNYSHLGAPSRTPILRTFQRHAASVERADPSMENPIYERSDDDEDAVVSISSETNDNVHFQQPRLSTITALHATSSPGQAQPHRRTGL